jgi:hypothetical protein
MKTFIQERLAAIILATGNFRVFSPDQSLCGPITTTFFINNDRTRKLLKACDLMKSFYRENLDESYLKMYWILRKNISNTLNR